MFPVSHVDMEMLRSQLALAAFLAELGEAVEGAELVCRDTCTPNLNTLAGLSS